MSQYPSRDAFANYKRTNVVRRDKLKEILDVTISDITGILAKCCGRTAKFNMDIHPEVRTSMLAMSRMSDEEYDKNKFPLINVFSKDGAHSLSNVQFASPVQEYVKNAILYVGRSVDNAAGDGTTTSMLFAARFLINLIEILHHDNGPDGTYSRLSTTEMTECYNEAITLLMDSLKDNIITVQDLIADFNITELQATEFIGWLQSYTSSHGDAEISSALGIAFSKIPQQCIEHIYVPDTALELEKKIEVEYKDYHFICPQANFFTARALNKNFHREYEADGVKLLNLPTGIPDDSDVTRAMYEYVNTLTGADKLVILAPSMGASVFSFFDTLADKRTTDKESIPEVVIIKQNTKTGTNNIMPWESLALNAMMNIPVFDPSDPTWVDRSIVKFVKENVRVHYDGHSLMLYNLFEEIPGSKLHPGFQNPEEYPYYTEYLTKMEERRNLMQARHIKDATEIDTLGEYITNLKMIGKVTIRTGGQTFEHMANKLVVQDCVRASIQSIKQGFILNAFARLMTNARISMHNNETNKLFREHNMNRNKFISQVLNAIYKATVQINCAIDDERLLDLQMPDGSNAPTDMLAEAVAKRYQFLSHYDTTSFGTKNYKYAYVNSYNDRLYNKDNIADILTFQSIRTEIEKAENRVVTDSELEQIICQRKDQFENRQIFKAGHVNLRAMTPPLQSVRIFESMFDRVRETILPIAFVEHVILPEQLFDFSEDTKKKGV